VKSGDGAAGTLVKKGSPARGRVCAPGRDRESGRREKLRRRHLRSLLRGHRGKPSRSASCATAVSRRHRNAAPSRRSLPRRRQEESRSRGPQGSAPEAGRPRRPHPGARPPQDGSGQGRLEAAQAALEAVRPRRTTISRTRLPSSGGGSGLRRAVPPPQSACQSARPAPAGAPAPPRGLRRPCHPARSPVTFENGRRLTRRARHPRAGPGTYATDLGWDVLYLVAATVPLCLQGIHLMRPTLLLHVDATMSQSGLISMP